MTGAPGSTEEPASSHRSAPSRQVGERGTRYEGPLAGLTERAQDAVTLNDRVSRRFLEVSDAFCALTGYRREELLGRTATEVGLIDQSAQRAAAIASAEGGIGVVFEPVIRCKDGALRDVEVSTLVSGDQDVVLTISRDITDDKQAQRELAAREARFRAAAEAARDGLAFISPVRDDHGEILDFRFEYVNDSYCALVRIERGELLGRPLGKVFPGFARSQFFVDCRQVLLTGEPCCTEDVVLAQVATVPAHPGLVMDANVAAMGETLVVCVRDVTERRRIEAQLRSSEERFQTAIGAVLDAFVILSPIHDDHGEIVDFSYEYVNAAYCTLVDCHRERLLGHAIGELFPEYVGSDRFALYRQVATTGEPVTSQDVTGAEDWAGSALAGRIIDTVIAPMGEKLVVYGRDVTQRWNAEKARAAAEAQVRDIIESAPDAMVIINADGEITLLNAQAERLFGYTRSELIGQAHELLVPAPLRDRHRAHRADYATNPRARAMGAGLDLLARRKDGSEFPVEISLSPIASAGDALVCSAIRDITLREQIEQELRHSRARLAEAERIARIGSWERDLATDRVSFSDGMLRIYGLSADQFDGTFAAARGFVYPDDRDLFRDTIDRAITERASYDFDYRAIRADGRVRTFRSQGDVIVNDNGEPVRLAGIVQDITDAKLTQEALQSTSAELGRRASELQQLALRTATESPDIPHAPLTARQLEIMQLIAQGLTNAMIAERLVVTEGTIKWHVRQVLAKTNSRNRAEAIARVLGTPQ